MVKKCNICSVEKNLSDFYKSKSNKDGLESLCKLCKKEKSKVIYSENLEHRLLQSKLYYYSNHEKQREVKNAWKKNSYVSIVKTNIVKTDLDIDVKSVPEKNIKSFTTLIFIKKYKDKYPTKKIIWNQLEKIGTKDIKKSIIMMFYIN